MITFYILAILYLSDIVNVRIWTLKGKKTSRKLVLLPFSYLCCLRSQDVSQPMLPFFLTVMCSSEPHLLLKHRAGYSACVAEVSKGIMGDDCLDPEMKAQILSHLTGCPGSPRAFSDVVVPISSRISSSFHFDTAEDGAVKEPRRLFSRDTLESRPLSVRSSISPYVVQGHGKPPSTGAIPLHYVPVLSTDSSSSPGMHHALVPSGSSTGLHLTDPLWRPWWFDLLLYTN